MIIYLKSETGVIKIDSDTKEALSIWEDTNSKRVIKQVLDESTYGLMTVAKVQEGFFTEINEEEFLAEKDKVKDSLIKIGF
jgi:hypothetical protein